MQHNTIQYNAMQHSTVQHNTRQYNTVQHNTTQHSIMQHNATQYNTIQHNVTQCNTTQYNTTHFSYQDVNNSSFTRAIHHLLILVCGNALCFLIRNQGNVCFSRRNSSTGKQINFNENFSVRRTFWQLSSSPSSPAIP